MKREVEQKKGYDSENRQEIGNINVQTRPWLVQNENEAQNEAKLEHE